MECPKCGAHIPEGHLYCENCGEEISFVPEFDPEVENRINETLSGVADNLKDDIFNTKKLLADDDITQKNFSRYIPTILVAVAIIFMAIGGLMFIINKIHSTRDGVELADEYYVDGNLDKAIEVMEEKIYGSEEEISPEELSNLLFILYEYQIEADRQEEAIGTLKELSDETRFDKDTVTAADNELIHYYDSKGQYDEIIKILNNTGISEIKENYSYYFSTPPKIYPEEGEYDEAIEVSIDTETEGDIYYTVNGDTPDKLSIKYEDALTFEEEGDYIVKAICINKYGMTSETTTAIYSIINKGPEAPEVMEESGDYSSTTMIVAVCESGCNIYYTTDGSNPTARSKLYVSPISMPLGTTVFKFVAVDEEGKLSEIVERKYHLAYTKLVSLEQARASIIQALIKLDVLLDENGKTRGEEGYLDYVYETDIEVKGSGQYYKFVERRYYNDGHYEDTGLLYAVNTHDGKVNRLGYDSSGNYTLITISNG